MKKFTALCIGMVCFVIMSMMLVVSRSSRAVQAQEGMPEPGSGSGGQWAFHYGGANADVASAIVATRDGGFMVAGYTGSFDAGYVALWVLKLNQSGDVVWQKTYGGSGVNFANAMHETRDGGVVLAGSTGDYGLIGFGVWVLRLDPEGEFLWQKKFGGGGANFANAIVETQNGEFVVAGRTGAWPGNDSTSWVVKLDENGEVLWQNNYAGLFSHISSLKETIDSGYIATGTISPADVWVIKLNSDGTIDWQKKYGGTSNEFGYAIDTVVDGGFVVAGQNLMTGQSSNFLMMRLDANGEIIWQKSVGGIGGENLSAIEVTNDGKIVAVGHTYSFGAGMNDFWIIQLDLDGQLIWQKTYGGLDQETAYSVQQTKDGGFVVAGQTKSFVSLGGEDLAVQSGNVVAVPSPFPVDATDIWVLKLDSNGDISGCSAATNSSAVISDTNFFPVETNLTVQTSTHGVTNTTFGAQLSYASPGQVCSYVPTPTPKPTRTPAILPTATPKPTRTPLGSQP